MSSTDIKMRIEKVVSGVLRVPPEDLEPNRPFVAYGFESFDAMGMALAVSREFGFNAQPNIAYDFPTLKLLTQHLESRLATNALPRSAAADSGSAGDMLDAIDGLSDDDAEGLLESR
jgi:acyl carrier protein